MKATGIIFAALDCDAALARIDGDGNSARMIGGGMPHEVGIAPGGSAEHDTVDAECEPIFDCFPVPDPAAELDAQIDSRTDRLHRRTIDRASRKGSIEVDDMQPSKASAGEPPRLRRRIFVEDRGACHLAAKQTDTSTILKVDRGEQDHGAAGSSSRSL